MAKNNEFTMTELTSFLLHYGFIYQGSEIYGGLANTWDYGPLGVELINNIKKAWWKKFIQELGLNVGLDSSIILNPSVWVASGHLKSFSDPLTDCKSCKTRYRADQLIEAQAKTAADGWDNEKILKFLTDNKIKCPSCGKCEWTPIRNFNLMFKTNQGVIDDDKNIVYLRPETCQGIFVNFKNVERTARKKIPFGIGQIGKSFRNEITPGNFIFRTREFEQAELEFFCKPGTEKEWFSFYKDFCFNFLTSLNLNKKKLRFRDHKKEQLAFYSNATTDIEYNFCFGWGELWGIASRTNYDLTVHQNLSKQSLEYFDQETNEKYIPYVVEPSLGVNRLFLTVLDNGYSVEKIEGEEEDRTVLKLHPFLAPIKACVLPLTKKLEEESLKLYKELSKSFMVQYDVSGKIGKRYRRQDAIGTPFCITYDFDSLNDQMVTVRERDTMKQERVKISELKGYLDSRLNF